MAAGDTHLNTGGTNLCKPTPLLGRKYQLPGGDLDSVVRDRQMQGMSGVEWPGY